MCSFIHAYNPGSAADVVPDTYTHADIHLTFGSHNPLADGCMRRQCMVLGICKAKIVPGIHVT